MNRSQVGTAVRFQYNPWINWSMMIIVSGFGLFGLLYVTFAARELLQTAPEISNILRTTTGLFVFAGLIGGLLTPARAFEIDARAREVRILTLYALGTRRRTFPSQEIAGFTAEAVQHVGPAAYWMYISLRNGRKVKLSPMAGRPDVVRDVNSLLVSAMSGAPNVSGTQPRRGFGRAA